MQTMQVIRIHMRVQEEQEQEEESRRHKVPVPVAEEPASVDRKFGDVNDVSIPLVAY